MVTYGPVQKSEIFKRLCDKPKQVDYGNSIRTMKYFSNYCRWSLEKPRDLGVYLIVDKIFRYIIIFVNEVLVVSLSLKLHNETDRRKLDCVIPSISRTDITIS